MDQVIDIIINDIGVVQIIDDIIRYVLLIDSNFNFAIWCIQNRGQVDQIIVNVNNTICFVKTINLNLKYLARSVIIASGCHSVSGSEDNAVSFFGFLSDQSRHNSWITMWSWLQHPS